MLDGSFKHSKLMLKPMDKKILHFYAQKFDNPDLCISLQPYQKYSLTYRDKKFQCFVKQTLIIGTVKQKICLKIVIIFLSICLNMCFWCSKELSR